MHTSDPAVALSVSGLNKKYGAVTVLNNLELTLTRGSILGLVGLNGSGKTTTIECILGLQSYQSGQVSLCGVKPTDLHKAAGKIVSIFDTPSLHPNLSVRQNLELARLLSEKPIRTCEHVEKLLGIERYKDYKVKQLSLGNKRRTSIAHALLGRPDLVVLDEPFNGLDAGGVDDVLKLIQRLNKDEGTSFFLCSHQLPYLEQICTHIAILHKGAIAASGAIDELLGASRNLALIKTEQIEQAQSLLASMDQVHLVGTDAAGYVCVELLEITSAELNACLVKQNISVAELQIQRASLAGLFREITSEATA